MDYLKIVLLNSYYEIHHTSKWPTIDKNTNNNNIKMLIRSVNKQNK